MNEPRQRTIGITSQEKSELEAVKKQYEELTGDRTDWGKFLGVMATLGLVALGINKMVKSRQSNPVVTCVQCNKVFSIAYSNTSLPIFQVKCPYCTTELVVDMTDRGVDEQANEAERKL